MIFTEHEGLGTADAGAFEQFVQKDFVGAVQDGFGIVDHDQSLLLGLLCEAVGVVIDSGCLADKQTVEFRQAYIMLLGNEFNLDAQLPAHTDKFL